MSSLRLGAAVASTLPAFHLLHTPSAFVLANSLGRVPLLCPQGAELRLVRELRRAWSPKLLLALREHYLRRLEALAEGGGLAPGRLRATWHDGREAPLPTGATLVCMCSAERAHAGRCHRWWAAPSLARAGWEVEVDGFRVGALRDYSDVACRAKEELGYHLADLQLEGLQVHRDWNLTQAATCTERNSAWRMQLSIGDRHGTALLALNAEDPDEEAVHIQILKELRLWATRWASEQTERPGAHRLAS